MKSCNKLLKRNILTLCVIINSLFTSCNLSESKLEETVWKNCGGVGPDLLVFSKDYLLLKKDTIYFSKNDSAIAIFDRMENYYGERRLFIKNLVNNSSGRYCEQ